MSLQHLWEKGLHATVIIITLLLQLKVFYNYGEMIAVI